MMENKKSPFNYFVDMSSVKKDTSTLAEFFQQQYQSNSDNDQNEIVLLPKVFTLNGILEHLKLSNKEDKLEIIHKIIEAIPANSTILFDETPIERTPKGKIDWSNLKNERNDVLVLVSFQPLIESSKGNTKPIKPLFPKRASIAELSRAYRISKSIFKTVADSIQYLNGIKRMDCEATPVDLVLGKKPLVLTYTESKKRMNKDKQKDKIKIKKWLFDQLDILKCATSEVIILYTKNTKKEVSKIFPEHLIPPNNRYQWDEFRGCENSVVICLFSSKGRIYKPNQLIF